MNHAISPVDRDLNEHYRRIEHDEDYQAAVDHRTAAIRAGLEAGDWEYLEELVTNGPACQRELFWREALRQLLPAGAELHHITGDMAAALQECASTGIEERVIRQIEKDRETAEEQADDEPWRDIA